MQSLERGLSVLTAFSRERPALTLTEVAELTGLTRATARRILLTLGELRYVSMNGRRFSLTPQVLDIGYAYLSSLDLSEIALPYMERLVERVHESSSASVLDGPDIVYVARVPTQRIMRISLSIGSRLPAHVTSMGRVLLAGLAPDGLDAFFERVGDLPGYTERSTVREGQLRDILDEVRDQGWALVDQEFEDGVRSVAAPLRDANGSTIAALNVSGHAGRVSLKRMRAEYLPALLETAGEINTELAKR